MAGGIQLKWLLEMSRLSRPFNAVMDSGMVPLRRLECKFKAFSRLQRPTAWGNFSMRL
jgi:hypothetical protein